MIRNYLKIAYRNIVRNKIHSLINILGMTIGLSCSIVLLLYIVNEFSYDRHHKLADRIYQINSYVTVDGKPLTTASTPSALAPSLHATYPQVSATARFHPTQFQISDYNGLYFKETFHFTDPTVFNIFSFQLLKKNSKHLLKEKNTVVISENMALRCFGSTEVLGRYFETTDGLKLRVTGVMENVPRNSHFTPQALVSYSTQEQLNPGREDNWGEINDYTYIYLPKATSPQGFEILLDNVYQKYAAKRFEKVNIDFDFKLLPLTDIHLFSPADIQTTLSTPSDIAYVYIFLAIAAFMLVVISINYTNLAIARSTKRAKEVGVRKVLGAYRQRIIHQFLIESVILSLISLAISLSVIDLTLPFINDIMGTEVVINIWQQPKILSLLIVLTIITGLGRGYYPALYLSKFEAANVLKGKVKSQSPTFRKLLIVVQLVIAIIMLSGTLVIYQQLHYLQNKDLGFQKDLVLRIEWLPEKNSSKLPELKRTLSKNTRVKSIATASSSPTLNINTLAVKAGDDQLNLIVNNFSIDETFIPALGIKISAGRNFDLSDSATSQVVINEMMAAQLGWEKPIGKTIEFSNSDSSSQVSKVIGVVKNFHMRSLKEEIKPMVLDYSKKHPSYLFIRIEDQEVAKTLEHIETQWKKVIKNQAMEFRFLADDFNSKYKGDQQKARILSGLSLIIVLITILGLFGLSAYTTQQRNKELNIRKIIGATPAQLFLLVTKEYVKLNVIAVLIAWPVAFVIMFKWLNSFAYHTTPSPWTFILPALLTFVFTLLTVSIHAIKSILDNPAKAIKEN